MALFEERGYDGTTVEDIATAANVSRWTAAYFEPELVLAEARVVYKEPALAAAGLAYQVRGEDALAQEVADDLGVDIDRDPRPRIVAHATVAIMRAGVASWLGDGGHGEPAPGRRLPAHAESPARLRRSDRRRSCRRHGARGSCPLGATAAQADRARAAGYVRVAGTAGAIPERLTRPKLC